MTPPGEQSDKRPLLQGLLIVLLIFLAYYPALRGQFLWDDDINVTHNRTLQTADGLRRIWTEPGATQQYYPLTHTSFWLDYHLWGMNVIGYHAVNIALHAGSALLLWRILKRLGVPGAWWGAALFALHPVCVETVAWITERKNALCGVFFLGSIFCSLKFWPLIQTSSLSGANEDHQVNSDPSYGRWIFYWLALFLYLCALWAKTAAVGLPAVIVLLLWWKRVKFHRRDAGLLLPFLAVGMALGLVTIWMEKHHVGAAGHEWHFSWPERCIIAGRALWFYLGKLLWPYPVEFMYPRWEIQASQPLAFLAPAAVLAGILILWQKRNGWARPVLFTAGYFIVMLSPVLGFFNVFFFRFSFVCDHFQYLACMAPLALAGAGLSFALDASRTANRELKPAICTILLLALGVLTWRQTYVYKDIETLWRETLRQNAHSWMAHNNLANVLLGKGNIPEAIQQFEAAIQENPACAPAESNLGGVLLGQGKAAEAIIHFNRALQINPNSPKAHYNLGLALYEKGDVDGAVEQYNAALQIEPDLADAHYGLGFIFAKRGQIAQARSELQEALRLRPNFADAAKELQALPP